MISSRGCHSLLIPLTPLWFFAPMLLVFLHKLWFSDMILWFSVAGPQVAESWLACGDPYGVWFSCGAGLSVCTRGFQLGWGFHMGFSNGLECSYVDFLMGVSFSYPGVFLQGGAFQRWSFPKEVLYVMLDSVDSNNRVINCI